MYTTFRLDTFENSVCHFPHQIHSKITHFKVVAALYHPVQPRSCTRQLWQSNSLRDTESLGCIGVYTRLQRKNQGATFSCTPELPSRHSCWWYTIGIHCSTLSFGIWFFYLENKGIVFKARWFARPDINTGRPLFKWNVEGIAESFHAKIMVMSVFISGRTDHRA